MIDRHKEQADLMGFLDMALAADVAHAQALKDEVQAAAKVHGCFQTACQAWRNFLGAFDAYTRDHAPMVELQEERRWLDNITG